MHFPAAGGPSDQALMANIVRRDEAALAALYERYHVLAFTVALRITGDRAVAEEVLQDVFHSIWRSAAGFQPASSVVAWLLGVARHRAIDATRAAIFRARGRELGLDPAIELPTDDTPDEQVGRRLTGEQVRAAMRQLPLAQRQVLELAYFADLNQAEIAARLGTPLGTVKTRLRLGRIALRQLLGGPELATPGS